MVWDVFATTPVTTVVYRRHTLEDAIELVLELPSQGFSDVKIRNPFTGEIYDEARVAEIVETAKQQEEARIAEAAKPQEDDAHGSIGESAPPA